jgi:cell wall-associated NlpC family hydrolase
MKKPLLILFLILSVIGKSNCKVVNPKDSINADSLVLFSKMYLGIHYQHGSCSPKSGFDCSGFVYFVFNHFNKKVPRSSIDYSNYGKVINTDSCKIGDIIVFTGTNAKNRKPGHVGIVVSKLGEEMQFIHSSSNTKHGGVKLSTFKESPYYKVRFLKIIRVTKVY